MTYFLQDLGGLALGTLLAPLLGLLPGFALLVFLERLGFGAGTPWQRMGWAGLLGLALLPALDALLVRFVGMSVTIGLHFVLAAIGGRAMLRARLDLRWGYVATLLIWWAAVAIAFVDFDHAGRLNQSIVIIDLVKHAAVVDAVARVGLPLQDPFFARDAAAGYYYFYYLWPAELHWLVPAIDSRMAFAATLFWTGPVFPALLWRLGHAAKLIRPGRERRFLALCVALCFVTGPDLVLMLLRFLASGVIEPQVDSWNEEVRFAMTSLFWVPHHIAALIACWCGLLVLDEARGAAPRTRVALFVAAGIAFAATFGMSVWIMLTAAPILSIWALIELRRGDRFPLMALAVASGIALVVAAPQIVDLLHGRADTDMPVALTVRRFLWWQPEIAGWLAIPLILILPLNYALEFGVFAAGAGLWLRTRMRSNGMGRLLLVSAIAALLIAGFLRSTIINNDLGWRSIWFAQLPAMLWTATILQNMPRLLKPSLGFRLLVLVGVLGNVWDLVGMRVIRPPLFPTSWPELNAAPANDYSQRTAYGWARAHLPREWVLQHNAGLQHRLFAFGLYGSHRIAASDDEANLFGAGRREAWARIRALRPVFEEAIPAARRYSIARGEGIDALVFTDLDPVWKNVGHLPADISCLYRDAHVCIAAVSGARK
ncbi:hypothetical protein IAG41_12135 [Sphingomonas sp. JC676]|uniref:hypothetical protein n=1 Tax=Sphingomonas sp. JC676 TaxID=2768065 RepID=UPI001657D49F|nr:hypothetical protein [Sphingomonas sp. JC676]MBC9033139.1 hypothetical protein [Sphingomonas sp. JC676]